MSHPPDHGEQVIVLVSITLPSILVFITNYLSEFRLRQKFIELHLKAEQLRLKADELDKANESKRRANASLHKAKLAISDLEADNERIKNEVALAGLNDMQLQLVHENSSDIDKNVKPMFKLNWRDLKFQLTLGSGTFGDCYRGSLGGQDVAVSFILSSSRSDILS